MRTKGLLLLSLCCLWLFSCDSASNEKQEVVVEKAPPPAIDSLQLQVEAYEFALDSARSDVANSLRLLGRLDKQLQDSIRGTRVPVQLQEETINTYKNRLYEVRQVEAALRQWQQQAVAPPDSLTTQQRKEYLEEQLAKLERLVQESSQVHRQSADAMQEADRAEY